MILASTRVLKKATSIVLASRRSSTYGPGRSCSAAWGGWMRKCTRHHFARCGLARGKACLYAPGMGG
jgi:hypothetical protein